MASEARLSCRWLMKYNNTNPAITPTPSPTSHLVNQPGKTNTIETKSINPTRLNPSKRTSRMMLVAAEVLLILSLYSKGRCRAI